MLQGWFDFEWHFHSSTGLELNWVPPSPELPSEILVWAQASRKKQIHGWRNLQQNEGSSMSCAIFNLETGFNSIDDSALQIVSCCTMYIHWGPSYMWIVQQKTEKGWKLCGAERAEITVYKIHLDSGIRLPPFQHFMKHCTLAAFILWMDCTHQYHLPIRVKTQNLLLGFTFGKCSNHSHVCITKM